MVQGPITLILTGLKVTPTHVERMITLQYRDQSLKRTVVHLQFTSWPELYDWGGTGGLGHCGGSCCGWGGALSYLAGGGFQCGVFGEQRFLVGGLRVGPPP